MRADGCAAPAASPPGGAAADYAHAALILLAFALFATAHLVHYAVGVMSVLGVAMLCRDPGLLRGYGARTVLILFACIWLPMLAALPDCVNGARTRDTVLAYLHFLPAALYLVRVCARPEVLRLVTQGVVALVLFAGMDAFAQLIWRVDLFGYPYDGHILKGVFHPKQRLGLFLAVFAPLVIEVLRGWCGRFAALWLLYVPLLVVLVMTLKRNAWLMLAVGVPAYLLLRTQGAELRRVVRAPHRLVLIVAVVAIAAAASPDVRRQVATFGGLVSGDAATFDRASNYRLTLWRTGFDMFADNWLNGVGPRGYRKAYPDYAAADDFWLARSGGHGQTHPHQLVVEVAAETGAIGLLGLGGFYVFALRALRRARPLAAAPVWLLCALVAWLPLNAHLAFYGSYWSTLVWLLLGIGLAPLQHLAASPATVGERTSSAA